MTCYCSNPSRSEYGTAEHSHPISNLQTDLPSSQPMQHQRQPFSRSAKISQLISDHSQKTCLTTPPRHPPLSTHHGSTMPYASWPPRARAQTHKPSPRHPTPMTSLPLIRPEIIIPKSGVNKLPSPTRHSPVDRKVPAQLETWDNLLR